MAETGNRRDARRAQAPRKKARAAGLPALAIRALSYDLARGQRADMDHLKYVLDALAELGFNMMTINLEHRFDFPSCPGIAPRGSLTAEMARRLVAYGRRRGVQVVPQPNLIGHCEGIGATERYAHLSCDPFVQTPWSGYEQLNLEISEAHDLVRRMLDDVCRAFPGDYIHIGGDEVRQLYNLFPDDPARQLRVMMAQFGFVLDLARRTGRQVMMWGDMPLHHEELMKSLPRDVIICDWHYGPAGSRSTLERYKAEGFRVLAAPAVSTCGTFCTAPESSFQNISKMVGDARELGLHGFLLTTWEMDFGSGFHLVWPWVALAGELARGGRVERWDEYVSAFAAHRYGVDGRAFVRLHDLLSRRLEEALRTDGVLPPRCLVTLRKGLFRAADPFAEVARLKPLPPNRHQQVWEPSPFQGWLYLRPVLTEAMLARLEALDREAAELADELSARARRHTGEMLPLVALAKAFGVLAQRLRILDTAKKDYHQAATAQEKDKKAFRNCLGKVAASLESLRPGISSLKSIVEELDSSIGLDEGEKRWLSIHEQSLDRHIEALRKMKPEGDALLEFGEFLRRPANVTPRLTWR